MNRLYTSLLAATALTFTAAAQQLPNAGFEDGWGACTPWTSNNNTKTEGTTPGDWTISQVIGLGGLGKTTVGKKVEGYNSSSAVSIYNSPNSIAKTQTVPGYITLGTTWSTAKGIAADNKDGGTFGGYSFTGRPVKITFMYKFERSGDNTQPANAIVYLWKGTYIQKDVPGDIAGTPKIIDMVNRDRNIIGVTTEQGGVITAEGDTALIALGKLEITNVTSEWTKGEVVLDYKSDATPEMINVIFAANDYFNSEGIVKGNTLTIDDVKCVYPGAPKNYQGFLTVNMEASDGDNKQLVEVTKDQPTTVQITPNDDNESCTFLLPNFELADLGTIGDIKVNNVQMKEKDGVTTYAGSVKHMKLLDGNIDADVSLSGTIEANNKIKMDINVIWNQEGSDGTEDDVPIYVSFNSERSTSAIDGIESDAIDENAPVEYYNIQGMKVNGDNLTPGFYIVRQGKKVSKIFVK